MSEASPTLYGISRADLAELLDGEPRYRVDQVWQGLYQRLVGPDAMTELPGGLRAVLSDLLPPALIELTRRTSDGDTTVKFLWALPDGHMIETVLMHYGRRSTVCVSSQAGCAMGCGFCATGQMGFERHLTTGEIVEQVVRAARYAAGEGRRVSNVVFMGMGEPLANYDASWDSVVRLHDDVGISARHITMSTVGVVPGIRRLAGETLPVTLAVSLHAARDELRDELVPVNRRYPLRDLAAACHDWRRARNRRLSIEWAMIAGVNDTPRDAAELAAFALPLRAHVNLIPMNPTPGYGATGSSADRIAEFSEQLTRAGVNATTRRTRGTSIDAACGQLRAGHAVRPPGRPAAPQPVDLRPRPRAAQGRMPD